MLGLISAIRSDEYTISDACNKGVGIQLNEALKLRYLDVTPFFVGPVSWVSWPASSSSFSMASHGPPFSILLAVGLERRFSNRLATHVVRTAFQLKQVFDTIVSTALARYFSFIWCNLEESTREKILEEAGKLFADKGFADVSIREICTAASANVAAVNYYFGDKKKLYVETVRQAQLDRQQQVPLPEWDSQTAPETKLRHFVRTMMRRIVGWQQAPWQVRLMMREVLFPTDACRDLVEEYFRPFMNVLLEIIDEFAGQGLSPAVRYQLGFSIVGQVLFYRFTSHSLQMMVDLGELEQHFQLDELAEHIATFALTGLQRFRTDQSAITAAPDVTREN